jgi:hypothetical protein
MTTRTFKQCGQAYGSTPASITATIGGTVVFSGPISTLNQPVPVRPESDGNVIIPEIFTWTNNVDFAGTQSYSIAVTGSPLLLTFTGADHCFANNVVDFSFFYNYEIDGVMVADPFTNVAIDGVAQQRGPDNSQLSGQWQWLIPAGSTFTATLNVDAGTSPYIQFDSIPVTIQPGSSGTFVTSIPSVNPAYPLPQSYGWRVVNITTTNADFQAVTGSITYNTPNASFNVATVAPNPLEPSKVFRVEIYGLTSGNIIAISELVTIT